MNVNKDRFCPGKGDHIQRGSKGHRRSNYFIPGLNAQGKHHEMHARRAGCNGNRMGRTRKLTEPLFKGFAEGACRDPPGLQAGYDSLDFLFADRWPTQRQKLFSYLHGRKSSLIRTLAVVWKM